LLKRPLDVKYNPSRTFDVPVSILDITRVSAALDWRPQFTFEEGLARMLEDIVAGRTFYSRA
jgi:UDP-glucose 4-epimerase